MRSAYADFESNRLSVPIASTPKPTSKLIFLTDSNRNPGEAVSVRLWKQSALVKSLESPSLSKTMRSEQSIQSPRPTELIPTIRMTCMPTGHPILADPNNWSWWPLKLLFFNFSSFPFQISGLTFNQLNCIRNVATAMRFVWKVPTKVNASQNRKFFDVINECVHSG